MASQITSVTIVYLTFNSDADQRKHKIASSKIKLGGASAMVLL